jgi:hypothetical protein
LIVDYGAHEFKLSQSHPPDPASQGIVALNSTPATCSPKGSNSTPKSNNLGLGLGLVFSILFAAMIAIVLLKYCWPEQFKKFKNTVKKICPAWLRGRTRNHVSNEGTLLAPQPPGDREPPQTGSSEPPAPPTSSSPPPAAPATTRQEDHPSQDSDSRPQVIPAWYQHPESFPSGGWEPPHPDVYPS